MRRGDVYTVRLDPAEGSEQAGTRPVLLVSIEEFNAVMPVVTVLPITTRRRERPVYFNEVLLPSGEAGLRQESLVLAHQIRTLAKTRLGRRVGALADESMGRVDTALSLHLGLEA